MLGQNLIGFKNELKENLLSNDIKDQINESIENFLNSEETTPVSLVDLINKTEHSDTLNQTVSNLINTITNSKIAIIENGLKENINIILQTNLRYLINSQSLPHNG